MKVTFEGVTRDLELLHIRLRHAVTIQEYTGTALLTWERRLPTGSRATAESALTDPGWITGVAAAHWLMLAQAAEDPPPLDDEYDCDVVGFGLALLEATVEDARAKASKLAKAPDPTVPPGRPARSSRRTAPPTVAEAARPLPTGS